MKTIYNYFFIILFLILPGSSIFAQSGIEGIPLILFTGTNAASITEADYDSIAALNVDVVHAAGVRDINLSPIITRGMKVIPDQLWMEPTNYIKQFTDAHYTVWEAEGINPVNGSVSLQYNNNIGEPFTIDTIDGIKTKNNAPTGTLTFGPGYRQDGQYRFSFPNPQDKTVYYTADFRLKIIPKNGVDLNQHTSDAVCTIKIQTRDIVYHYSPFNDWIELVNPYIHPNSTTLTVVEFLNADWITKTIQYDWSTVPHTASNKSLINQGTEYFGLTEDFSGKYVEFIIDWFGSEFFDLYFDKVTVHDQRGIDIVNPLSPFRNSIINEAQNFFNNNDAIYAWYGIDEPYTIDNYEPYRIVDSIVYAATNHVKRIVTTLDNGMYGKYVSEDGNFKNSVTSEFWKRAKPEKIIVNMYPYHYPYTPEENPLYWYYDAEYFTRYKYPAIREVDPNFGVTLQAFGSNKYEDNVVKVDKADPSEAQMLYNLNTALLFGAKEIALYLYFSTYDYKFDFYEELGLVDKDRQPTNKYYIVKNKIVPRLKGLFGQTLITAGQVIQATGLNLINGPQFVTGNHHLDFLSTPSLEIDKKLVIDAGIFKEPGSSMPEYIMLVNRWYSTLNEVAVHLKNLTGNKNWTIKNLVDTTFDYIIADGNNKGDFNEIITHGDAAFYSINPAVIAGGKINVNEIILTPTTLNGELTIESGAILTVNARYDAHKNITVKSGGKIICGTNSNNQIVFHGEAKLILEGNAELSGLPTNKLVVDFLSPASGREVYVKHNSSAKINNCIIKNAEAGVYADNDVEDLEITNNTFENCHYGISLVQNTLSAPYINNNTFTNCGTGIYALGLSSINIAGNQINALFPIWLVNTPWFDITLNILTTPVSSSGAGIYLHSCSGGLLRQNTISNFDEGIFLAESSPLIGSNNISGNCSHGIYVGAGSHPDLTPSYIETESATVLIDDGGLNEICNNGNNSNDGSEIYVYNSQPYLDFGYNTIMDDRQNTPQITTELLLNGYYARQTAPLNARLNYWGMNGADPSGRFGVPVNYIPFITQPGEFNQSDVYAYINDDNLRNVDTLFVLEDVSDALSPLENLLALAENYFYEKSYDEALNIYKDVISTYGEDGLSYDVYARLYIINMLLRSELPEFAEAQNIYETQTAVSGDDELNYMLGHLISLIDISAENYETAINDYNAIADSLSGSEEALFAEMDAVTAEYLAASSGAALGKTSGKLKKNNIESLNEYYANVLSSKFKFAEKLLNKEAEIPKDFALLQNYPNPFNPQTKIGYALPKKAHVNLTVFDILGRKIITLVDGYKDAGSYEVVFNAKNYASGVYVYRLTTDNIVLSKKMLYLK